MGMNDNLTLKEKVSLGWNNFKNSVGTKVHNTVEWAKEHPVEVASIIGASATVVSKGYKWSKLHEEKLHRERDFYDARVGKYTRANRKLKGWERDEIEMRYNAGESYNRILGDMGLRK